VSKSSVLVLVLCDKSDFELDRNLCEKKPALCEKHTSQFEKKINYVFLKHRVRLSASCEKNTRLCDFEVDPIDRILISFNIVY
jgi:hypothetical protein